MAVRKYIGARYVPLYDGTWDATKNYEPLTIVDDGNGNSYTSRKDVPAGTDLTNRDYWIQTSSFSGAIQQLQDRVYSLEQSDKQIESDVDTLQTDVGTLQENVGQLEHDVEAIKQEIEGISADRVLFISDSYGSRKYNNKSFAQIYVDYTGDAADFSFMGSIGFSTNPSFANLLSDYTGDKTKVKKIYVVGGANDLPASASDILAGMQSFKATAADFVNAEILIFPCGVAFAGAGMTAFQRQAWMKAYNDAAALCGFGMVENAQYVLHNSTLLESDLVHPNGNGVNEIAKQLVTASRTGSANVEYVINTDLSLYSGISMTDFWRLGHLKQVLKNDTMYFMSSDGALFEIGFSGTSALTVTASGVTNQVKVGISSWLTQHGYNIGSCTAFARVTLDDSTQHIATAIFYYSGNDLMIYFAVPTASAGKKVVSAFIYDEYVNGLAQ